MFKLRIVSCIIFIILLPAGSFTPVFLQAISSALATIPYTGFPLSMTAGLAGAKLAVGAKLLYYLGFFGRQLKPSGPPTPGKSSAPFMGASIQNHLGPQGFLPLPYSHSAGVREDPFQLLEYDQNYFSAPFSGINRSPFNLNLIAQALTAQGVNPLQLVQAFDSVGLMSPQLLQTLGVGSAIPPTKTPGREDPERRSSYNTVQQTTSPIRGNVQDFSESQHTNKEDSVGGSSEKASQEEIESFFSFLRDMDDNKCISRLVCDIGADPDFLGEFSLNINAIINALDVSSSTSGANEYLAILNHGREHAGCDSKFPECHEGAYELVKSVAPSVGVPGMNSES